MNTEMKEQVRKNSQQQELQKQTQLDLNCLKDEEKLQFRLSSSINSNSISSQNGFYSISSLINNKQQQGQRPIQSNVSFDEMLSKIGIGPYQYVIYAVLATIGLTEGAQIQVYTIPVLADFWDIGEEIISLQICLIFMGFLVGSMVSGQFADRYGRRQLFIYCSFLTAFFTFAQAASSKMIVIIILRVCNGIIVGFFGSLAITLITEITPFEVRGKFKSLITVSIQIGKLYGWCVGYFTLNVLGNGNWRLMVVLTGLPGAIAWIVAIFFLKESPRFDIIDGRYAEGFKVLAKMNKMNGNRLKMKELNDEIKGYLINWSKQLNKSLNQKKGNLLLLFLGDGRFLTPLIWFNQFSVSFIYFGIIVLMPKMMDQLNCRQGNTNETNEISKLALSTSCEIIAGVVASFLVELKGFGRKNSFIICLVLESTGSLMIYFDKGNNFIFLSTICAFFLTMAATFNYQFTAEVYSTKIRTTGIGMANGIGKGGAAIVPWASQYLQTLNFFGPFLLFSSLSLLTALVDFIIPYDTLGRQLDILNEGSADDQQIIIFTKKIRAPEL